MTPLSPCARAAVRYVVELARHPTRPFYPDNLGSMLLEQRHHTPGRASQLLDEVRLALGVPLRMGSLAAWGRGKSAEEVAQALETVLGGASATTPPRHAG